ncbi:MAG: DUF6776 family protein [Alcaligenaceae bacterium]
MARTARRTFASLIGGVLLLLALGVALGVFIAQQPNAEALALQVRTERAALLQERQTLEAERTQADSQFNVAQRDLLIERAARAELEKLLESLQTELGRQQDQLAFLENLLPPGPQGSLDIRALDVQKQTDGLHYRVLLMRSGKNTKRFEGMLQFVGVGHCLDAAQVLEQRIVLQPLVAESALESGVALNAAQIEALRAPLRLDFAQFQRGQGLLAVPQGFALKSVTVRVLAGDIVLASKVVDL